MMNMITGKVDPLLYQLLVDQTRDYALFLLDPEGRVMTWNPGAERIKGYAADEILGRHFSTFYTPRAVETGWPDYELKIAMRDGRFEDEGWRVRKDGSRFWASVVITALRDANGRLLAFGKITRDLTDRKQQEETLRESEERFRLLVEGVTDYAIYMLDPDGFVTSWNAGAARITGYARDEIVGKHFSRFFSDDDVRHGLPWEELAAARRVGRDETEGWRIRKDGALFWARVVVTALHDHAGRLRGYAKVTQDLTDRRHLQDLEKAARNVNEFIGVLAHELRNPLAPIRSAVHVMSQAAAGDPVHQTMLNTIDRQSRHLGHILDDMLDIARLTRGKLEIAQAAADLAAIIEQAVEVAKPAIDSGRHRLEVEMVASPLTVKGDAHRLVQLFGNLLNNAARYTPEGGLIRVTGAAADGMAVMCVHDNGLGIASDMQERIFDMFVQGRSPQRLAGSGLGVGLALARRIAELHEGTLTVYSEGEGRGSQFTVRLPLAQPGRQEAARPAPLRTSKLAALVPRRILVVDDNVDAAGALELLLRSLGHETRTAHDGKQALDTAAEFQPDTVLLDIGLPGLDGYEVARRLRAMDTERPVRIIAVTGWGTESDREKSRDAGFDVHLVKPVDGHQLARLIDERTGSTVH